jgi:hypothetical protein
MALTTHDAHAAAPETDTLPLHAGVPERLAGRVSPRALRDLQQSMHARRSKRSGNTALREQYIQVFASHIDTIIHASN